MYYALIDSTGNLIDTYDSEGAAKAALAEFVRDEPEIADHVAVLAYDDQGEPVGEPLSGSSIEPMA